MGSNRGLGSVDFIQMDQSLLSSFFLGMNQQLILIATSHVPGDSGKGMQKEKAVLWEKGRGEELTFIECLLCSRHFTQISSFNVVAENQSSGVTV